MYSSLFCLSFLCALVLGQSCPGPLNTQHGCTFYYYGGNGDTEYYNSTDVDDFGLIIANAGNCDAGSYGQVTLYKPDGSNMFCGCYPADGDFYDVSCPNFPRGSAPEGTYTWYAHVTSGEGVAVFQHPIVHTQATVTASTPTSTVTSTPTTIATSTVFTTQTITATSGQSTSTVVTTQTDTVTSDQVTVTVTTTSTDVATSSQITVTSPAATTTLSYTATPTPSVTTTTSTKSYNLGPTFLGWSAVRSTSTSTLPCPTGKAATVQPKVRRNQIAKRDTPAAHGEFGDAPATVTVTPNVVIATSTAATVTSTVTITTNAPDVTITVDNPTPTTTVTSRYPNDSTTTLVNPTPTTYITTAGPDATTTVPNATPTSTVLSGTSTVKTTSTVPLITKTRYAYQFGFLPSFKTSTITQTITKVAMPTGCLAQLTQ